MPFDLDKWRLWKDSTDNKQKSRLAGQLLKENEPLLRKYVQRVLKYSSVPCEEEDAMQAGRIGFMVAMGRFDPNRPTKFSTMLWPWVRYEVAAVITKETKIKKPRGAGMNYQDYRKCDMIETRLGRPATAEDLGVSQEMMDKWRQLIFAYI